MENQIEKKIIQILRKNPEGLTIVDIAKRLKIHRHTVSKYIYGLARAGIVYQRRIGVVSICYLKERFVEEIRERDSIEKLKRLLE